MNIYNSFEKPALIKRPSQITSNIRYVDDFVLLHSSKSQPEGWKQDIDNFLQTKLKLKLHPDKSRIISLSNGIDFAGFRNFYYFKLLRKRNIKKMLNKIKGYHKGLFTKEQILEIFQGWNAYAKWANTHELRRKTSRQINKHVKNI